MSTSPTTALPPCARSTTSDPIQIIDYKALVGDKSDNIPGVKGIGKVGAVPSCSISTARSKASTSTSVRSSPPARRRKLEAGPLPTPCLSKDLATIRHDAPVELDLQAADVTQFEHDAVAAKFDELEFRTLREQIPGSRSDCRGSSDGRLRPRGLTSRRFRHGLSVQNAPHCSRSTLKTSSTKHD